MPDTENVFVQADILDAAIASPANLSLPLVPLVRRWLGSNYRSMIPRKTASLAVHLARSGELDQALKLMRQLLFFGVHEQVIEPELGGGVHADAYPKIAAWDYQEIASHEAVELAGVVGMRALEVFCKTLSAAIASTTGRNTRNGEDLSSIWCPSVEEATGQGAQVVLNALVVGIRGAALLLVERSQASVGQILSTLQHFKWRIFQRLALHVLRSVTSDQIGLVAASLGNRALFESSGTRHEYDLLLQDWFGELDEHQRRQILRWAMRPNLNSRRARYRRRSGVKSSPELEARWKAYWQRDRLAPIAAMLPPYWSHRYDRLVAELGSSDFPRARTEVISWVGSLSPKTAAELDKMEMAEIADFLRNWDAPSELAWGPTPTADGLAQELAQSVKKRPLEFSKFAEQFQDCRSEYAGAILTGLTEAAREGTALDWESILGLAGSVVARVSEEDQGSLSGDVWSWRGRQVAGLLSTGLESTAGQIPSELRGSVWDCIAALARHSNPTPEHEVEFGGSNMDPSTLSINTVRGEALHAAIRSIYGQWFPWLMLLGQEWAVRNRARIFPPNAAGHDQWAAAWTAYVVFNQPHDNVWPLLRDEYRFALEHLDWQPARTSIVGSPVARLAEHLMLAYLRGELSLDDELLSALFASSEASIRRHAISFVGRVLGNGDTLPSDLIKRAIDLWEHRLGCAADCPQDACLVEEIEEFGWWFASGTLDIRWALQQLHAALSLSPSSKPEHQVVQQLAVYAPDQPEFAIQCISLLVRDGRHAWQLSSWRQSMREIIVAALTSTADASRCAQQLVNELGRKGFIDDFRDLAA